MAQEQRPVDFSGLALLAGGFILVAASIGGYLVGALIDAKFGTAPKGAVTGLVLGTIVGFWDLYRVAARIFSGQSVPTREQQKAAQAQWEKAEKAEKQEGDRDENHE